MRRRSRGEAAHSLRATTRAARCVLPFSRRQRHHWDAIEAVLERHGLALAIEQDDGVQLMGVLTDVERRAWDATYRLGKVDAGRSRRGDPT